MSRVPSAVHPIGVESAFRRRGIGKHLAREGLRHAKAVGRKKVKMFTRPWNIDVRICAELGLVLEATPAKRMPERRPNIILALSS